VATCLTVTVVWENTGNIQLVVVTPEANTTTEFYSTNTILGISGKKV
jgi:hypothetical protein